MTHKIVCHRGTADRVVRTRQSGGQTKICALLDGAFECKRHSFLRCSDGMTGARRKGRILDSFEAYKLGCGIGHETLILSGSSDRRFGAVPVPIVLISPSCNSLFLNGENDVWKLSAPIAIKGEC